MSPISQSSRIDESISVSDGRGSASCGDESVAGGDRGGRESFSALGHKPRCCGKRRRGGGRKKTPDPVPKATRIGSPIPRKIPTAALAGIVALGVGLALACSAGSGEPGLYFGIRVVDDQTGRGVPLVELETVNHLKFVTDSAGWIAFHEPGLMGERVFFFVRSHGYESPKDGFGFSGVALQVAAGKKTVIRIKRLNIAERMYRLTGQGIYRDSLLLDEPAPLAEPLGGGKVAGQDSAFAEIYRETIFWFWGDTSRMSYPLGHFNLGEIWYSEASDLTGPWRRAKKIVTHDRYSFYNPVQHPFFDQDGGRVVYFEGTYTQTFSGNPVATPRYDYNQIMYRLDLDDERLSDLRQ